MYRTYTCGDLNITNVGQTVTLAGWLQRSRDLGGMTFIDLRDRYGITQLAFNMETNAELCEKARKLGREYVLQVKGVVIERSSKNAKIPTGEIEIDVKELNILNAAKIPPFTIEDQSDGGDDLRMKYRYLDLRRNPVRRNLELRHRMAILVRNYLNDLDFLEIETPFLIKSTPEGARDFVVPSRMNPGEFYALPQSPQQYKQLLMVAGFDRYFQIVRCFRDEDLRADRQPEFTQIDCEMSFVEQEDVLQTFEGLAKHLFKEVKGIEFEQFPRMTWHDAMRLYGSDKPDIRFGMQFVELNDVAKGKGFGLFDNAELIVGICAEGCAEYTRKQLDALSDFVKRPQVGAGGLVYIKYNADSTFKSSVDKFYTQDDLNVIARKFNAKPGDLMLILCGPSMKTRVQLCALRLEMGNRLGLRNPDVFAPLWVIDFPLLEWDDETQRYYAMHHPFTAPKPEDEALLDDPSHWGDIRANAYDIVMNGVEVGGGSIRIHDRTLQNKMFHTLGFTDEQAQAQFGFLMDAFTYGAPPHAGLAFGFDRLCSLFGGADSIRDFIAFPKNNSGRDVMSGSPSPISMEQLEELQIKVAVNIIMADNYLEKRYDEVFGTRKVTKRVGHTLDELLLKNRSTRGYIKDFVVSLDMLMQIVSVNTKIPSGRNAQTLRFYLVTRDSGEAPLVLKNVKMGALLPELHLPLPGTEPEAFIIVCGTASESRIVDVDLGISIQSMLLKAAEMGLSGLTILAFNKEKLTEDLHLPLAPLAVIAIGKGKEQFRLVPIHSDESHSYYREGSIHCVPKLTLDDLILPNDNN